MRQGIRATVLLVEDEPHSLTAMKLALGDVFDIHPAADEGPALALLRVLTEGSFTSDGGHEVLTADLRLMAGAHRDLAVRVTEGQFRADLYFALCTTELTLPPLEQKP